MNFMNCILLSRARLDIESLNFHQFGLVSSTPNVSRERMQLDESDVSIVKQTPSTLLLITDNSIVSNDCKFESHFISGYPIQKSEVMIKENVDRSVETDDILSEPISFLKITEALKCECGINDNQREKESTGVGLPVNKTEHCMVHVKEIPFKMDGPTKCDCGANEVVIVDSGIGNSKVTPLDLMTNSSIVHTKESLRITEVKECDCEENKMISFDTETGTCNKDTSLLLTADSSVTNIMGSMIDISKVSECECGETKTIMGIETESSKITKPTVTGTSKVNVVRSTFKITGASNCDYGGRSLAQVMKRMDDNNVKMLETQVSDNTTVDKKEKKLERKTGVEAGIFNDSVRAPSLAESSSSEAARLSLENKLMATMQILKNKEETVRVQAESLALAEARIAALATKTQQTSQKLHQTQQTHPLFSVRSSADGCHVDMTDVSATADLQDVDQKIVNTLRDNLSVIEELYRECFYESAKQEEMITMLRRSYLDMRLMEKQKTEQIGRLQSVVHSQRCSLERCQDIALEVENLKSEISNFLNSSQNNDSGVWEREECAGDVTGELRVISNQLRRLQDLLNTDCTCGLEEENKKLKRVNEKMEIQMSELRQRVKILEEALGNKENMDQQYQVQIQVKEQELQHIRNQLFLLEEQSRGQDTTCDTLNLKLQQLEVLLNDKTSELLNVQQQCEAQEVTIKQLRDQLNTSDSIARDNGEVRDEVSKLGQQVSAWREQLAESRRRLHVLEAELQRARDHCRHLADHYREKSRVAAALRDQLQEAQARGAVLCGESRRAVCAVRRWLHDHRQKTREQEDKIKQQEVIIQNLRLGSVRSAERTSASDEPSCSKYLTPVEMRRSDRSLVGSSEMDSCSKCPSSLRTNIRTSESEMASSPTPPTPPRRLLRKKPLCGDIRCQWPGTRSCGVQRPHRNDASVNARLSCEDIPSYRATPTREVSPTDELLERVERAHEALAEAHHRWGRHCGLAGSRRGDT